MERSNNQRGKGNGKDMKDRKGSERKGKDMDGKDIK